MKNYVISWIDIKHNFLLMKIDLRQSHKLLKMIINNLIVLINESIMQNKVYYEISKIVA